MACLAGWEGLRRAGGPGVSWPLALEPAAVYCTPVCPRNCCRARTVCFPGPGPGLAGGGDVVGLARAP